MNSAWNMTLKKLTTATPVSDARTIGSAAMNRMPAVTPSSSSAGGGSSGRMEASCKADPMNDRASMSTANGALSVCTSSPPTEGPPSRDIALLPYSSDCPSTYLPGSTIDTNSVPSDTVNSTENAPATNVTAHIWANVSTCS